MDFHILTVALSFTFFRYMKYMNDAENGSGTTTCTSSSSS